VLVVVTDGGPVTLVVGAASARKPDGGDRWQSAELDPYAGRRSRWRVPSWSALAVEFARCAKSDGRLVQYGI
jgi:hypothetical protein